MNNKVCCVFTLKIDSKFSVISSFFPSAASTECPDAGPASEGTLQHPAPPAPAFPAEGPADETEHGRSSNRSSGIHWNCQGPQRSPNDATTAATTTAAAV